MALCAVLGILFSALTATAQEIWVATYNGPANASDFGHSIAVDSPGNVYVTGWSIGTGWDYATIKYNNSGTQQWVARYNGPGNGDDEGDFIAVDSSGNVYVAGLSTGSGTGWDYATIKYNTSGTQQWVARYNGPGNLDDVAQAMAVDLSGNAYVTGKSQSSNGDTDYATIKYNASGAEQWVARYKGPGNSEDIATAIALDGSGNVVVTGYSTGSGTGYDFATIKYNGSGTQQWVDRYNGPANGTDAGYAITVDTSGSAYATGERTSATGTDYATIKYYSCWPPCTAKATGKSVAASRRGAISDREARTRSGSRRHRGRRRPVETCVGVARLFAKLGIAAGHFRDGQPGVSCGIAPDEKRGQAVPASDDIRTQAGRSALRMCKRRQ